MSEFNNLIELVQIPAGSFLMGSPDGEGCDDEMPQHLVTLSSFQMGKYPVTQAQYEAVMSENPSYFNGDNLPVERVSWYDSVTFCQKLSKLTGQEFRLPTEAEWEYACRAGTTTPYSFGEELTQEDANFNSDRTSIVGSYPSNVFGLYDTHGNVWEWCQDIWCDNYEGAPTDGSVCMGGGDDSFRLVRGGSWYSNPRGCRSAYRNYSLPDNRINYLGFRVVCGLA